MSIEFFIYRDEFLDLVRGWFIVYLFSLLIEWDVGWVWMIKFVWDDGVYYVR